VQLATIRKEYAALKPEEIRVIDPCMGSGHILCVLFDVLVRIYGDYGYTAREAAVKIVENNLWGLDIDERAAQLSYFAVMMKARQYDRRFFTRKVQPHVYAIEESNGITSVLMHDMGLNLTQQEYAKAVKQAMRLVEDPLYLATLLIKNGDADGEVAGARNATGDVLRPAFQIVKTLPGVSVVSGAFIMILKDTTYGENGMFVFADCAATPCPTAEELGQIAVVSAQTAKAIAGFEDPRVAILSFSTKGSAKHELVDKVIEATRVAHELDPNVHLDGELQADAAIVPKVGASKAPGSDIAGKANVLVFPDLQSGNICYKLVQRLAGAEAVGPVMQGMAAPINDLSRGCSVEDVVNVVAITATQAASKK
jgi:phosphate acetyltransferase